MPWTFSAFTDEAGGSCDEQIAACRRGHFKHIDIRRMEGSSIIALDPAVAQKVRASLDAAGIKVNMFGSPIGKIDISDDFQKDLNHLEHLAKLSPILGCNQVRMFSYYNRTGWDKAKWEAETLDRLKRLRDRAGELGLVLFHENEAEIFGDLPEDVAKIAELRDGKAFKLIYDFGNYVTAGVDHWQTWQMFKNQTDAFHFKDKKSSGEHMPLGQGDGMAKEILADAVKAGWQGPVVLEPHLDHSPAVMATGPSGTGNKALADLAQTESFQIAVDAAQSLMKEVGAEWE